MQNIEVKILNPEVIKEAEKMMVCGARMTQRGHVIKNMDDFMALYEKPYLESTAQAMAKLPHPAIQKFGAINLVIVGASRRFLAQITRHQNEVKFMSASLQYSDYTDQGAFAIPYEILEAGDEAVKAYLADCQTSMIAYKKMTEQDGYDNDTAGYIAPQGLRNILIVSATPYQLKHMIRQRACNRNTKETQYVMLKLWEALYEISPLFYGDAGPFCTTGKCHEGKMCCGKPVPKTPAAVIAQEFPLLAEEKAHV